MPMFYFHKATETEKQQLKSKKTAKNTACKMFLQCPACDMWVEPGESCECIKDVRECNLCMMWLYPNEQCDCFRVRCIACKKRRPHDAECKDSCGTFFSCVWCNCILVNSWASRVTHQEECGKAPSQKDCELCDCFLSEWLVF